MEIKLFYILLFQIYLSKAQYPGTVEPAVYAHGLPYQQIVPGGNVNVNDVNRVVDCQTRPGAVDQTLYPVYNQNSVPLTTNGVVSQSLKDESQSRLQNVPSVGYVPQKSLYVYEDEDAKPLTDNLNLPVFVNDSPDKLYEESRRKAKYGPSSDSESTELGKIVENCLTKKLKLLNKNRLVKQDFLNTRRKNFNDSNAEDDTSQEDSLEDSNDNIPSELEDPTQAVGLRRLSYPNTNVLMMKNKRVCYACTSANNPSCWQPNRQTTVKYCRQGNEACVTKTYNAANGLVVIRDCANSCDHRVGIEPQYNSCSVCHSDLCNNTNGATVQYSISLHSLIFGILMISFLKKGF